MSAFAKRWRDWMTLLVGVYLPFSPRIFGVTAAEPSFANAGLAGLMIIMAASWTLIEAKPRAGELTRLGFGAWLLASPIILGFTGSSGMAWNAWIVGALMVSLTDARSFAFALVILAASLRRARLRLRTRLLSPEKIVGYEGPEEPAGPGRLCWHIVERSHQIHDTLHRHPSEAQVEACILGHAACMHDLTTLTGLIADRLPKSGPLRRRKLGLVRWAATRSIRRAGEAFPEALGISQRSCSK